MFQWTDTIVFLKIMVLLLKVCMNVLLKTHWLAKFSIQLSYKHTNFKKTITTTVIQRKGKRQRGTALHRGISNMQKWLKRPSVSDSDSREKKNKRSRAKRDYIYFLTGWGSVVLRISKNMQAVQHPQKRLRTTDGLLISCKNIWLLKLVDPSAFPDIIRTTIPWQYR